jgi:hypothetical protein
MPLSRKEQPRCLIIMGVDIGKSLYAPNNGLHLTTYRPVFQRLCASQNTFGWGESCWPGSG